MRAIVTGGSRGIGLAIVNAFKAQGVDVVSLSRSEGVDLLDKAARADLFDLLDCDILVNNAWTQQFKPAAYYTYEMLKQDFEWLHATLELCQLASAFMRVREWGRIINIASIAGIQGTRNCIGYSMAKAALIEMTKCLSNEWAWQGITVNALAPGYIVTDMLTGLLSDPIHAELTRGRIPAGDFGRPADVAAAVLFLASNEAQYITGTCLPVDGGWLGR